MRSSTLPMTTLAVLLSASTCSPVWAQPGSAVAAAPAPAAKATKVDLAAPLPTDPSLVTGTLDNGLKYIVRKHATPPGRLHAWLNISSGSLNETDEQRGLAHYLEHMAFNGSENFPPGQVVPFFESLGLTFGRHQNAFTSFDQTTYQLALPDVKPENVDKALLFLSDVLLRLKLPAEEIDKERGIILEEKRSRLSPQQRVGEEVLKRLSPGSTFGERIPIGTEERIQNVQRKNFTDYYGMWYVPSNATLMVVADAEPEMIVAVIRKHFSGGTKVARPADRDAGVKPSDGTRAIVVTDPELTSAEVSIVRIDRPLAPTVTVGQTRSDLVRTIGTWAFNRRMSAKVASGKASFLTASADIGDTAGAIRQASASATGKPEQWRAMLAELGEELARARQHGFTENELADAKRALLASAEQAVPRESTMPANAMIGRFNRAVNDGEPIMSASQRLELMAALLPGVTAAEVSETFTREFDTTHCTFVLEAPSGPDVPSEADMVLLGRRAVDVKPAKATEEARATSFMERMPTPGTIAASEVHAASAVRSAWLSNGVRYHFRAMDQRKDDVTIVITLAGGSILESAATRGLTEAGGLAWARRSTKALSSTQVRDLLTGKKVNVLGGPGGDAMTLTVSGSPAELETGLQLAHLLLTEPRVEPAGLENWKTRQAQTIEARKKSPQGLLGEMVNDTLYPAGEVRLRQLTKAQVDAVTVEAAQAWLDKLVATAPVEVTVVGDISQEKADELVLKYLGSLGARPRIDSKVHAELRKIVRPVGPIDQRRTGTFQTPQAVVLVGFFGTDAQNTRDVRLLRTAARVLTSRMVKEIREEKQLVYSIGTQSQPASEYPGFGLFLAAAPTEPGKTDALAAAVLSMYQAFAKDGPTEEEMEKARKQTANELDESMKEPSFWVGRTATMDYRGLKLDDAVNAPAAYQAQTAAEVKEAFNRYFRPETTMTFVVKPEAAPAPAAVPVPKGEGKGD